MKAYRVDCMEGQAVVASHAVKAMAPYEAARTALGSRSRCAAMPTNGSGSSS